MTFDQFLEKLSTTLEAELPGQAAHQKMAPIALPTRRKMLSKTKDAKESAVLALLYPNKGMVYTVLMLRNSYDGVHSAQVSFPGGKKEQADVSLQSTALRETEEEIGINQAEVRIIGNLSEIYIPPSNFWVKPFVGYLKDNPKFVIDKSEVDQLIKVPLRMILDDKVLKTKDIWRNKTKKKMSTPYFDIHGHVVWGATAMILSELKEILKNDPELTSFLI